MNTPISTEPMYLIGESELQIIDDKFCIGTDTRTREDIVSVVRARGPVAQQAPDCFNDISGDGVCEHAADPENGGEIPVCTIIGTSCCRQEIVDARPSFYQIYCGSSKHDAAIAAQEREKFILILDEVEQFIKRGAQLTLLRWNDVEVYFEKKRESLRSAP